MDSIKKKLDAFGEACRGAGLRLTHQRLEIFRELAEATDHPSPEIIYKRLKRRLPTISLDTIYRTLSTLEKYNLIKRVQTMENQARFEAGMEQHHHLICRNCREIIDFKWENFDTSNLPADVFNWGRIENKNVVLYGLCKKCLKREN